MVVLSIRGDEEIGMQEMVQSSSWRVGRGGETTDRHSRPHRETAAPVSSSRALKVFGRIHKLLKLFSPLTLASLFNGRLSRVIF